MPRGKKGKELRSRSRTTRKSTNRVTRGTPEKALDDSATALAPPHETRSGLISRAAAGSAVSITDDPESILRKARRSQRARGTAQPQDRPEIPSRRELHSVAKSIGSSLPEENRRVDDGALPESFDEELPPSSSGTDSEDTDPEEAFNHKWGYLPPLDEEAVAIIDAILADPGMGRNYKRTSAGQKEFPEGLRFRNVSEKQSPNPDPYACYVEYLPLEKPISEPKEEKEAHEQLWSMDQAQCKKASNEALFQRTLMMSLIARHVLIYDRDSTKEGFLDFSVEEAWSCPPMPSRAYKKRELFLSQPKPDLAVCFRREALIPEDLWSAFPKATMRLACYENAIDATGRLFHFLTIEAKKAYISADDDVGKRQSLNNASQALHNMFEFFRDAGPQHENVFFEKVRFFSVVASTEGLTVRIHRATQVAGFWASIIPEYPLKFEYQDFFKIQRKDFDRKIVMQTFEKILIGYGANELRPLLRKAAEAIMEKLKGDPEGEKKRQDPDFYRYGQTDIAPETRSGTPVQSRVQTSGQASNKSKKRQREQSADSELARTPRQKRRKRQKTQ